ncbi:MAG: SIMPL domain-containing protein [Lachnospiraceae bacterium]|nr:SIMPL domain-containing protein [Lachnospiraceae bacterium]
MSNMRTIRVTGRGQLKVHPDMTRIIITLEGRHKEYGETLQRSSRDTERLKI